MRNRILAPLILLLILGSAGCGGSGGGDSTADSRDDTLPPGAIRVEPGTTLGKSVFPIGDTPEGGQGQTIADVPCDLGSEDYHIHIHLSLFVNGEQIAIPAGIGFKDPVEHDGTVEDGICLYGLHTHDTSGVIHVEAPAPRDFTLGQLFAIWGRPLTRENIAGYSGSISIFVNETRYDGDPAALVFESRQRIVLVVGDVPTPLPAFDTPYTR